MSFQQYLAHLRAKPPHVHSRIAFGTAFMVTAVIFAFWASSFSMNSSDTKTTVAAVVNKAGTPAESLLAGVGNFFNDLKDIIIKPKEITYGEVEVKGGKR